MVAFAIMAAFHQILVRIARLKSTGKHMNSLLHSKYLRILTLVIVVQAVLFYSASHGEGDAAACAVEGFPDEFRPVEVAIGSSGGCRDQIDSQGRRHNVAGVFKL